MARFTTARSAALGLILAALSTTVLGQSCRKAGTRCAGAENYPAVEWINCCDGSTCTATIPGQWGTFCSGGADAPGEPSGPSEGTCHKTGARCIGAPGKPLVPWKPCCESDDVCVDAPDWGSWCAPKSGGGGGGGGGGGYSPTTPPDDTCHGHNVRCAGAPGKPFVEYKPCCVDGDECVADEKLGWGWFCTGGKPVDVTTAPPDVTTAAGGKTTPMVGPGSTTKPVVTDPTDAVTTTPGTVGVTPTVPDTESSTTASITTAATTAPVTDSSTAELTSTASVTTPANTGVCEGLNSVRPDITTMSNQQWNDYVEAVYLLREKPGEDGVSVLENFEQAHANFGLHRGAYFAPWHRAMLWEFEKELDSVKPGVRIPTYDWSENNLNALETPVFSANRLGGSVGMSGGNPAPIPNGPFEGLTTRASGSLELVERDFDTSVFLESRSSIDVAISAFNTFSGFAVFLEGIHDTFHVQIGGRMNNLLYSPGEPAFYIHHAFVDKVWREWQQFGNGNIFGGTQPAIDGSPVSLDAVMQPFGRTVRSILEDISGCVEYTNAPSRSAFTLPVSDRELNATRLSAELDGIVSEENIFGSGFNRQVVPKRTEAAGKETASIDSTAPPTEPKLESVQQKRKLQRRAAVEKTENPGEYKEKVLVQNKVVTDSVQASARFGASPELQALLSKTLAFVSIKKGIDLTDVDEVFEENAEEIAEDGKAEVAAIDNNDEEALPERKRDDDGTSSKVSIAVDN